jgi:predicted molibdopterin-dependent oxidoreductase YjgC
LDLNVKDGKVIRVTSNAEANGRSVNGLHLCVKGRYGYEFIHNPSRHQKPRVREYLLKNEPRPKDRGKFVDVDWETALNIVARKFQQIRDEDSTKIGVLASGHLLNEESYLLNKLARQGLGTNNIDIISNLYFPNSFNELPAMTNSLDDVAANAQAFFIIGSNLTEQHPVFGARIRQNILRRKIKAVVASPDFINIEEYAALSLRHLPGTEEALINGLMNIILEKGWANRYSLQKHADGPETLREITDTYTAIHVAELTGIPIEQLYAAAQILASRHPMAVLCGSGIADPKANRALINLQILLENFGIPGGVVNILRAENNTQGAIDMGCVPNFLTGYQSISDANARSKFEQVWGCRIRSNSGMNAAEMIANARALYVIGEDILNTSLESAAFRKHLENCEFIVLQEMAFSETTRYADVILPGVSFAEKTGTFTNTERRVQMVHQAIEPIGESRPDWQIIADLGTRLGTGWNYTSTTQIMDEVHSLTPIYAGISHERLGHEERLQWPVESESHPGTPILPVRPFIDRKVYSFTREQMG